MGEGWERGVEGVGEGCGRSGGGVGSLGEGYCRWFRLAGARGVVTQGLRSKQGPVQNGP